MRTLKKLEKLMDAKDEVEMPMLSFPHGPNPYLDRNERERCLLCNCERQDPPEAAKIKAEFCDNKQPPADTNAFSQLPLWVCPSCRKAADQEIEKKSHIEQFYEPDLTLGDPGSLSFLQDISIKSGSEPTTPNGSLCTCEACTERRLIESDHERETQELQRCWTELRNIVRLLYCKREVDGSPEGDEAAKEHVHRLCCRDPHQLFLRLESQVREFVIEMKVKLLKQLNSGFKTPPQAKHFISLLLDEYGHLCRVARKMAGILGELQEHLKRFNVTWDLHNKHLFQSIAYTEPSIQNSLHLIIAQLRMGAASKESYNEDTYPNLLHRYLKFDDEMSVISVVWRDCQQLIEAYNEEQAALKLKQKMLREDWEFFKSQRKLLEQQVSKSPKASLSHSLEAQFTETMRMMLQGSKPTQDECHCPRCNRKRCPCDECTITHMITCGIINPEILESSSTNHNINFPHDPNRYRIDVSPPSMSSTTSSSGSVSPILVDPERLTLPYEKDSDEEEEEEEEDEYENVDDIPEEIEDSPSYDEDDDEDDDDDEEEDDDEDDDDDLDEDEEEEEKDMDQMDGHLSDNQLLEKVLLESGNLGSSSQPFIDGITQVLKPEATKLESCNCDHCSQVRLEQLMKVEENQCQCHVCLQQQGKTVSTSLPQHVPPVVPRPGELHLYPHIHGSTGLHGLTAGRNHIRPPLLQPQLYDLHLPIQQRPKPIIQSKVPMKLDFETPDGIHEHIYHAYGDWDNTYDPRLLSGSPRFSDSELLPPPPLSSPFGTSFLPEFSIPNSQVCTSVTNITSSLTTSTFTTASSLQSSYVTSRSMSAESAFSIAKEQSGTDTSGKCNSLTGSPSKSYMPPCTRPATLGGNNSTKPSEKVHSQHCKKHNLQVSSGKNTGHTNHNHNQLKVTPEFIQSKEGRQMVQQIASTLKPSINSHSCNHGNSRTANHLLTGVDAQSGNVCANSVSLPTSVNSVGTSTVYTEPDCDGHHDDNYDSIDDSCSEQSSSTSTSNQKEGKYCDCCYCEFFGHTNPPMAPTSKNYHEMREKLRLRLKKRNELKGDEFSHSCANLNNNNNNKNHQYIPPQSPHPHQQDPLDVKGLDELVKFINGAEEREDSNGLRPLSAKAAKRARQKQRKAEEKARLEAERLQQEQHKAAQEKESAKKLKRKSKLKQRETQSGCQWEESSPSSNSNKVIEPQRKKTGKHKDRITDTTAGNDQAAKANIDSNTASCATCDNKKIEGIPKANSRTTSQSQMSSNSTSSKTERVQPKGKEDYEPASSSQPNEPEHLDNRLVFSTKPNKNKVPKKVFEVQNSDIPNKPAEDAKQQAKSPSNPQIQFPDKEKKSGSPSEIGGQCQKSPPSPRTITQTPHSNHSSSSSQVPSQSTLSEANNNVKNQSNVSPRQNGSNHIESPAPSNKKRKKTGDEQQQPSPRDQNKVILNFSKNMQNTEKIHLQNGMRSTIKMEESQVRTQPLGQSRTVVPVSGPVENKRQEKGRSQQEDSSAAPDQGKGPGVKNKKNKKKNRGSEDVNFIDEVFMPKSESDIESGEMDEFERELEEFKRFCLDFTPATRQKLQVNVNIKDIFMKKKSGLGCS
ncbi:hypothetical protein ACJMK2_005990 [Sinanodonta woodiana]|uniref:FAM193 C-terminal domain-containing protein n=1 Tax=Sinanodonta woodiana TaxID=1069815 RepID=A0ABD3VT46_SINWO